MSISGARFKAKPLKNLSAKRGGAVITFRLPDLFTGESIVFPDHFRDRALYLLFYAAT
jgi:hypothetical protein